MSNILKSPFPYFGGKSKIAGEIWKRMGRVDNVVEPFFGSGAFLLARPMDFDCTEMVNDADGFVSNFWRALKSNPEEVAFHAAWPVNENDLHARHSWLVSQKESMQARLEGDPEWFDCRVAGWWVWGMACWIGDGFCSGKGPWHVVNRKLVHASNAGQGINRKRVHAGDAGQGINRKRERLGGVAETGDNASAALYDYLFALSARLRRVRVCCGDWSRVIGPSVTFKNGLTAVFLDPPYADTALRASNLYRIDNESIAHDVRDWAVSEGLNPLMRIALCGYEGEHVMPDDWDCLAWNAGAGLGGQKEEQTGNGKKERVWFSPHCLAADQLSLL